MTSMIKSKGSIVNFVERPISVGPGISTMAIWLALIFYFLRKSTLGKPQQQ
jgi:hypothetical protein